MQQSDFYEYSIKPIDQLKPNPDNPNIHDDKNIGELRASIQEWGFTNPILADEEDVIIAGHGRWQAAKEEGYTLAPTITLKGLSESQKRAYIIADNSLPFGSIWDEDKLEEELEKLEADGFDLSLLALDNIEDLDLDFTPPEFGDGHAKNPNEEFDQSDTKLVIGEYSFPVSRKEYLSWQEEIRKDAGFTREEVIEEMKVRLRICLG
ncbi:ParB/Srx family N-terminal domain-containing protein [Vibrio astriarenae]|uniref:ParB/Srx family N-terminal domain-containing protein n=1 Tax=Vibrio astriarenae TaxID=1481923 RepID=UPI003735E2DB